MIKPDPSVGGELILRYLDWYTIISKRNKLIIDGLIHGRFISNNDYSDEEKQQWSELDQTEM